MSEQDVRITSDIEFTSSNWPLQYRADCVCGAVVETFDRVRAEVWLDTHVCEAS